MKQTFTTTIDIQDCDKGVNILDIVDAEFGKSMNVINSKTESDDIIASKFYNSLTSLNYIANIALEQYANEVRDTITRGYDLDKIPKLNFGLIYHINDEGGVLLLRYQYSIDSITTIDKNNNVVKLSKGNLGVIDSFFPYALSINETVDFVTRKEQSMFIDYYTIMSNAKPTGELENNMLADEYYYPVFYIKAGKGVPYVITSTFDCKMIRSSRSTSPMIKCIRRMERPYLQEFTIRITQFDNIYKNIYAAANTYINQPSGILHLFLMTNVIKEMLKNGTDFYLYKKDMFDSFKNFFTIKPSLYPEIDTKINNELSTLEKYDTPQTYSVVKNIINSYYDDNHYGALSELIDIINN